jgi:L-threonylcarbamoyladenylate synthase
MDSVDEVVSALVGGCPVLLPTDTVYGLCARADREEAVLGAYRLKGRPEGVPSAVLCGDLEALFAQVPELQGDAERAVRALLPGPYTLVLPNPARRFPWLNREQPDAIGVRVPALAEPTRAVLDRAGSVMATSANHPGGADPRRLDDVPPAIRAGCGAELDGGALPGVPSTVLDLTGPEPRVLREAAVAADVALARLAAAGLRVTGRATTREGDRLPG